MNSSFSYEFLRIFSAKCQNSCEFAAARRTETRTSPQPLVICIVPHSVPKNIGTRVPVHIAGKIYILIVVNPIDFIRIFQMHLKLQYLQILKEFRIHFLFRIEILAQHMDILQ